MTLGEDREIGEAAEQIARKELETLQHQYDFGLEYAHEACIKGESG